MSSSETAGFSWNQLTSCSSLVRYTFCQCACLCSIRSAIVVRTLLSDVSGYITLSLQSFRWPFVVSTHSRQQGSRCAIGVPTGRAPARSSAAEEIARSECARRLHPRSRRRHRAPPEPDGRGKALQDLALLPQRSVRVHARRPYGGHHRLGGRRAG